MDQVYPQTANNMIKVLEKLDCGINYNPDQTCCGHPAFTNGYWDESKAVGEKLIHELQNDRYIVCPSALCAGMIKTHYASLFHNSSLHNEYKAVQKYIYEFSDFLVNVLNVTDVGAKLNGVATFHDSCKALRELNIKSAPRILLGKVKELELVEMTESETCCGYGTGFSQKFENIAVDIAEKKAEQIISTGCTYVVSTDYTCLMHIDSVLKQKATHIQTMHIADVLASGW
jgi:L-lactate dehydrogenase complex protein LldE